MVWTPCGILSWKAPKVKDVVSPDQEEICARVLMNMNMMVGKIPSHCTLRLSHQYFKTLSASGRKRMFNVLNSLGPK